MRVLLLSLLALAAVASAVRAAVVIGGMPDNQRTVTSIPPPGVSGYVFYATGATTGHDINSSSPVGISSGTLSSPVNFLTIDTSGDQFFGSADSGDTPLTIKGVAATTGMAYQPAGPSVTLATLTLGANTPPAFRLGVLDDNVPGAANNMFWTQVTGLNGVLASPLAGNDTPRNDFFYFNIFNAAPGDHIPVGAVARPGATNVVIGGLTFDVPLAGDTNMDGTVDFSDLVTLARFYGGTGSWTQGDFNNDGKVGFDDLVALATNYGRSNFAPALESGALQSPAVVPEPSCLFLLLLAAAASVSLRLDPGQQLAGLIVHAGLGVPFNQVLKL